MLLRHGLRREGEATLPKSRYNLFSFHFYFFPLFTPLSFQAQGRRYGGNNRLCERMRGCTRAIAYFYNPRCHYRGGKVTEPSQGAVRGTVNQVYTPPLLLIDQASYDSMEYRNHIPNGPHDCRGASNAQGSKAKPASRVSVAKSKQS
jgi:hypothetical protein